MSRVDVAVKALEPNRELHVEPQFYLHEPVNVFAHASQTVMAALERHIYAVCLLQVGKVQLLKVELKLKRRVLKNPLKYLSIRL